MSLTMLSLRRLALALTLAAGFGAALAGVAAAKDHKYRDHPIYNDRQPWSMVDRNQDGKVSSKEWSWAEKNSYDRLSGVPKKHLTRNEYQRYLTAYLDYRSNRYKRDWNQSYWNQRDWNRGGHRVSDDRGDHNQGPWYVAPGQKPAQWDYRGGHPNK